VYGSIGINDSRPVRCSYYTKGLETTTVDTVRVRIQFTPIYPTVLPSWTRPHLVPANEPRAASNGWMDWQEWGTDLLVLRSDELSYALGRQVTGESARLASGLCLPIACQEQSGFGGIPCGMDNIPCDIGENLMSFTWSVFLNRGLRPLIPPCNHLQVLILTKTTPPHPISSMLGRHCT
jgi:hypothetical protein